MKLETKYGMLEGTVEEFKELLEEKDLSFFSGKIEKEAGKVYKIVNKEDARCHVNSGRHIPKGLILKHVFIDRYVDTIGNTYMMSDEDLDDYNKSWVEVKFNMYKKNDWLLVQKEGKYKVVEENIYFPMDGNSVLEKGTVLVEIGKGSYEDSLGRRYHLQDTTVLSSLGNINGDPIIGLHFEEHQSKKELYKVEMI
ncbi:hypothetical protein LCFBJUUZ_CDS0124 [Staphylococcus phage PG-2021_76]|uniref:Uncharacterized protein n=1 Tax=Mammaliicoccus phage MSShimriz1 TaxID=3230127 RepID=A0AAU8GSI2_9VIRU